MTELSIRFKAIDDYAYNVCLPPSPAKEYVPKWWKDMQTYTSENIMSDAVKSNKYAHVTSKKCFPMLDGITAGYIIPLWADVEVTNEAGIPKITWLTDKDVFGTWSTEMTNGMENPSDTYPLAFKFLNQFITKTPAGWSSLFTHPIGFPNLPFHVIPGVVDTDVLETEINPPLWMKKDFSGIIKKGTPIAQVIPFQRQNWSHTVEQMGKEENYFNTQKYIKTVSEGAYGLIQRVKKNFN